MESISVRPHVWQTVSPDGLCWALSIFPMRGKVCYTVICGGQHPCHGNAKLHELDVMLSNVLAHYSETVDTTRHYIKVWLSECCREMELNK